MEVDTMGHQALLHNKKTFLLFFAIIACHFQQNDTLILNINKFELNQKSGITYYKDMPFNGLVYELYVNSLDTLLTGNYKNGTKIGIWKKYYPNGKLLESRKYVNGIKEGDHIGYYPDGKIKFVFQLKNNEYNGFKKAWTKKGNLILHMNYKNGYEAGSQKVWYDNGIIKSNYILKNGRRYGLFGTKNCINVKDSIF